MRAPFLAFLWVWSFSKQWTGSQLHMNRIVRSQSQNVQRAYRKYGIRQARLDLIQKWSKLCSRHYKEISPHKNKRIRLVIPIILENTNFWDKKPTSEAWITIPRWASENTKGTRILLSLWGQNTPHVLGLLHGLSWCISDLPYFQVRLLSKVAWNAKWDMRTLP